MLVLKSILPLFLIYVFAAANIIVPRQDLGADKSSVRLLDEKTAEIEPKIKEELGLPISERTEREQPHFHYYIEGTQVKLVITPLGRRLAEGAGRLALEHVIRLLSSTMVTMIHEHGDSHLPVNPYILEGSDGGVIRVVSNTEDRLTLTYRLLNVVAQGLMDALINDHRFRAAIFEIWCAGIGRVGSGSIRGPTM